MEIKIDISDLERIRERFGVPLKEFTPKPLADKEAIIKDILIGGVEIDASEVELTGPFLTYRGVQAILYIKDTMQTIDTIQHDKHKAKKFHVVWCKTLEQKHQDGSFQRYIMTRRADGIFKIDAFLDEYKTKKIESEEELYACQNCLRKIDYQNFERLKNQEERRAAAQNFDIGEFLDEFEGVVRYLDLPMGTDKTEPLAEYNAEFARRSPIVKNNADYRCEECGVDLRNHKKYMHCHHKDHRKHNNALENLAAICALCHRDNHHKSMYVSREDELEIKKLRGDR